MKVALNQLLPKAGNPEANYLALEQTVKSNVTAGAKLCIFPEDFLFGVLRGKSDLLQAAKDFDIWIRNLCGLAKKYSVDIVPGTLPSCSNGHIYNHTVYINKLGLVTADYSKSNLWLSERSEYSPSMEPPRVFESPLGKTAIIICWDMLDHRLFETAIKMGAEWVICLSFWSINQSDDLARARGRASSQEYTGFSDSVFLDALVQVRALEYNVGILFCNFGGQLEYLGNSGTIQKAISAGHTQISLPYQRQHAILRSRKQATLLVDIDMKKAAQTLKDTEIWYARREDIVLGYPRRQRRLKSSATDRDRIQTKKNDPTK